MKKILVCGAGGFIGGHLVADLRRQGHTVRAADKKPLEEWYQRFPDVESLVLNLERLEDCHKAVAGCDEVYNLAADMGGMGFIELNKALCMLSVLINTHLLIAARAAGRRSASFSPPAPASIMRTSSAIPNVTALKEEDAYPALPEDGYGWEKLFSERMCRHFREDFGIATRVGRYHNVYGPLGTYDGGREKAPAAMCRKVIEAKLGGSREIEIWGSGEQTRSFMYIDDCLKGTQMLMNSDFVEPMNIGSSELVSINQLVSIVEEIAGIKLERKLQPRRAERRERAEFG